MLKERWKELYHFSENEAACREQAMCRGKSQDNYGTCDWARLFPLGTPSQKSQLLICEMEK